MTTIDDVRNLADKGRKHRAALGMWAYHRDQAMRELYDAGGVTLAELAKASGLSKQRVHMIVNGG